MNAVNEIDLFDVPLSHYANHAALTPAVAELEEMAARCAPKLAGRTVWMVNSTAQGGGVAEMLPTLVGLLRGFGVAARWAVINCSTPEFFKLTKRVHNLIHGLGTAELTSADRELYESVSRDLADAFRQRLSPRDMLVIHDPQPAGMGALLKKQLGLHATWRCHIGLEHESPASAAGWSFLRPYVTAYDHAVFSAEAYVPSYLSENVSIVEPTLDPLSEKNRELSAPELASILCGAGLLDAPAAFAPREPCERISQLTPDGRFLPLSNAASVGLLFRPTVTQISRWDRLKGWAPLLEGFVRMKRRLSSEGYPAEDAHVAQLRHSCLILAGPEPEAVQDDPEACEVLDELTTAYRSLDVRIQRDVAILSLPMKCVKRNAVLVNGLQRSTNVVIQNSVREGFGLTVAEAMWKGTPVLGSTAFGIRQQIRDGIDGTLVPDPTSAASVEETLLSALADRAQLDLRAKSARRRAYDRFLIFRQVQRWLELLSSEAEAVPWRPLEAVPAQ